MTSIEIGSTWARLGFVALSAAGMVLGIVAYVRIVGLRSFSKMSSFDFAVTVAIGSILGAVALSGSSLVEGLVAIGALLATQAVIAWGRRHSLVTRLVDNRPLALMIGSKIIHENLRSARVTEGDLRAKLRGRNVLDTSAVRYVILETTGDVSILHGDGPVDEHLLRDVVGAEPAGSSRLEGGYEPGKGDKGADVPSETALERTADIRDSLELLADRCRDTVNDLDDDPQAKALLETTAETLLGLHTAFGHFAEGSEEAWRAD